MSHRKVNSQGNIPFSWEDKPGVSKSSNVTHYDHYSCPIDGGLYALNRTPLTSDSGDSSTTNVSTLVHESKVPPPPPCSIRLPPRRSTSLKGLRWLPDDPFLAAYKECTKNGETSKKNTAGDSKLSVRKKKMISFSCNKSCDVRDDNLVRLSNLPTLPKDKILGRLD